ncbi:MAG: DUF3108 domain-containing protein [Candidatus Omnitrophica bacterium]|nr:DUF3108 domain-containing protein [Candidatus Omnitrophota bacterium]
MMKKFLLVVMLMGLSCPVAPAGAQIDINGFIGEKITYSIKQMGVKAGEAVLSYEGPASKDDKEYVLIVFKADGMNFLDFEKIYADPVTLLPKIVERDVNIFGSKEQITEYYETETGRVRIVKTVKGKTTEQVITKKGGLDNIYCFIYRYRRDADPKPGESLAVNLPTVDLKLKLKEKMKLSAAGKKYDAVFIQSDPAKYKLWFDTGKQKIPLRIDGAVGVGSTTMTMKSYETKSVFAFLAK